MLCVALTASSYFSTAVPFRSGMFRVPLYFTINSFYSTYTNTDPQCVYDNPTTKISLSIGVFYLAIVAQLLCFQVSEFEEDAAPSFSSTTHCLLIDDATGVLQRIQTSSQYAPCTAQCFGWGRLGAE